MLLDGIDVKGCKSENLAMLSDGIDVKGCKYRSYPFCQMVSMLQAVSRDIGHVIR